MLELKIFGVIEDTDYAYVLSKAVEEALIDDKIKAVVLEIDSPGGAAYLIEQVYLDLYLRDYLIVRSDI